jgi:DNA-binding transcriptional regulator PaaX
MDYNQLKLKILELFNKSVEYESSQVLALVSKKGARHNDKAIEMALLRYWRQGLLRRERRGGRFYYSLSERGEARRTWLRSTMGSSEA